MMLAQTEHRLRIDVQEVTQGEPKDLNLLKPKKKKKKRNKWKDIKRKNIFKNTLTQEWDWMLDCSPSGGSYSMSSPQKGQRSSPFPEVLLLCRSHFVVLFETDLLFRGCFTASLNLLQFQDLTFGPMILCSLRPAGGKAGDCLGQQRAGSQVFFISSCPD